MKKKCEVEVPGDNSWTAYQLIGLLEDIPSEAKVRTFNRPGLDPAIVFWWEEEI